MRKCSGAGGSQEGQGQPRSHAGEREARAKEEESQGEEPLRHRLGLLFTELYFGNAPNYIQKTPSERSTRAAAWQLALTGSNQQDHRNHQEAAGSWPPTGSDKRGCFSHQASQLSADCHLCESSSFFASFQLSQPCHDEEELDMSCVPLAQKDSSKGAGY